MTEERPKATHAGELEIGNVTIPCAVLNDGTRVISERGVTKALGAKRGGAHWRRKKEIDGGANLPVFISAGNLKPFIDKDLMVALTQPILFRPEKGGGVAHGVEATVLPKICEVWLKARDEEALVPSQLHIAEQADVLMRGLAHVGIIALIDEVTGYQEVRDRIALQKILEKFIEKELRPWTKRFPNDFYRQMFRLKGWQYSPPTVKRPSVVGHYTNDLVYERLAPGVLDELRHRNPPDSKGRRSHRHHQWLTLDVGHPKLQEHLLKVIVLMKASPNWSGFKRLVARALPKYGDTLEFPFEEGASKEDVA